MIAQTLRTLFRRRMIAQLHQWGASLSHRNGKPYAYAFDIGAAVIAGDTPKEVWTNACRLARRSELNGVQTLQAASYGLA